MLPCSVQKVLALSAPPQKRPEDLRWSKFEVAQASVLEADDRRPIRWPGLYQFRLIQEPQYPILAIGAKCVQHY
jgi:hypothetical protein